MPERHTPAGSKEEQHLEQLAKELGYDIAKLSIDVNAHTTASPSSCTSGDPKAGLNTSAATRTTPATNFAVFYKAGISNMIWLLNRISIRYVFMVLASVTVAEHQHHMKHNIEIRQSGNTNTPLSVANFCPDTIYPAVLTQGGTGPQNSGFQLTTGSNKTVYVSGDWQGRVWGRTNCSFTSSGQGSGNNGQACQTGDCAGALACKTPGVAPATLAEFTLNGSSSQTFYDISLVDGYNLPLAIVLLPNGNQQLQKLDPATTNPSCVASVGDLAAQNFNPYTNNQQFLGTSSQSPLPFEDKNTASTVANWCPWDLQVSPPLSPGGGVYPYPDGNINRPPFDPCFSACAKYNQDSYCCTGQYDGSNKCSPNYYSKAAKGVCPDAYSYAYDDQTSTFITPTGAGFQVIFCPGGRSTNIIASKGSGAITHSGGSSGSSGSALGGANTLLIDAFAVKLSLALTLGVIVKELLGV